MAKKREGKKRLSGNHCSADFGEEPNWFQLFEQRVIKRGRSAAGHEVVLVKGRRGKKYGCDRYYGVRHEMKLPKLAERRIPSSVLVYIIQTSSKREAVEWYRRALRDDLGRVGRY